MKKLNVGLFVVGMVSLFGTVAAMSTDELYDRLVYDIAESGDFTAACEMVRAQKEVLWHGKVGQTLFHRIVDTYATLKDEIEREKAKDENVDEGALKIRCELLEGLYVKLLGIGKKEKDLEALAKDFERYFKLHAKRNGFFLANLTTAFPETFKVPDDPEDPEEEEEKPFVYKKPSEDITHKAFRFQNAANYFKKGSLWSDYIDDKVIIVDLEETDLSGTTLMRHLAQCWRSSKPRSGNYSQWTHRWWEQKNARKRRKTLKKYFSELIEKQKGSAAFVNNLDNLMDCFLVWNRSTKEYVEKGEYKELIDIFNKTFPGKLNLYRLNYKGPTFVKPSDEKTSAYFAADIFFCANIRKWDNERDKDTTLSNAFEFIKEHPSLANACDDKGMPLLYKIVERFSNTYDALDEDSWNQKSNNEKLFYLQAFFEFLLLNGADIDLKGEKLYWNSDGTSGSYENWPSVRELFEDPTSNPDSSYSWGKLNEKAIDILKGRLDAFLANKKDSTKGKFDWLDKKFAWIEERMHVPAAPKAKPPARGKQPANQNINNEEDMEATIKRLQDEQDAKGKSFWQATKSRLKPFIAGAAVCGAIYWFYVRTPHDRLAEREAQRAAQAA